MQDIVLRVGVSHARAHVPAVLDLVASGAFDPRKVAALVVDWDDAPKALCERATKVILTRKPLNATFERRDRGRQRPVAEPSG